MQFHSEEFCLTQAAAHMARAEATTLPNVRAVNLEAAKSWMKEAESARRVHNHRERNAAVDADHANPLS